MTGPDFGFEPYYTPEAQAMHDALQQEIMRAFNVKPWLIGLASLPRRVRLRLWLTRQVNGAGIWLVEHGHLTAAERLWRICRMW